ncbi:MULTISPECIES: cyclic nucleotide-binding domain-containing protein [Brucella/Ochrobactrum group]|uniref:cyclic nucleotide-binding domain-containing protein n=1 Tax=Brucella/Ochrobactrum group TaxID=2826938 RepID=UPI000D707883|nr:MULTISPECIES: cyclic nucleotide-binding domain-containing protein [Brucella/Ochrobactrum group]MCH4543417.1 cyclic nucleotide-binding domain-containing protein [Ochrobactrum sp. A-1]PWU75598.1 transcriptional regulator [Ochrobactrum sp. POC9]
MRKEDIDALRNLPLFMDMADATFERIMRPSFVQSFPPRTTLIKEDEPADFLFAILDGLVLMSAKSDDGETALEILRNDDIFILAAVLNDDVCLQTAQTLTPTRVLMVPSSLVRDLMSEDLGFMRAVVFETARSYRRLVKELKAQKLRSSVQRLANWIVKESLLNNGAEVVMIPYEKRTLAAYLGMTPENLSRNFATLGSHGVSVQASAIKITNKNRLLQFAAPSHLIDREEPTRTADRV